MLKKLMNKMNDHPSQSGSEPPIEPDNPPILGLLLFLFVSTVIVAAVGFACKQLLMVIANKRNNEVNLSVPSPLIQELKSQYNEELSTYAELDKEKGHYRIPIDYAMEILVKKGNDNP